MGKIQYQCQRYCTNDLLTPLTQQVLEDEKLKKIFLDRIPLGRAAVPEDMVGASVYLVAPSF